MMSKRERLEKTAAGEAADRLPVMCWRHFPGDDQRSADLARSLLDFQTAFDWDILVAAPANTYLVTDYGASDEWQGDSMGIRQCSRRAVERSLDWTNLRPLDPGRGAMARVHEAIRLTTDALRDSVPVIVPVFGPLVQAAHLSGETALLKHIRTQPDRVHTGLNTLTESTLRWIDSARRLPIAGFLLISPYADYGMLSEDEYAAFGYPYDKKLLDSIPSKCWFNMVHLGNDTPMFKFAGSLKAQALHWHDRDSQMALTQGKSLVSGAVCGGVSTRDMTVGTPIAIRDAGRDALVQMAHRRLILSAGGGVAITTPNANFRALREAVERSA